MREFGKNLKPYFLFLPLLLVVPLFQYYFRSQGSLNEAYFVYLFPYYIVLFGILSRNIVLSFLFVCFASYLPSVVRGAFSLPLLNDTLFFFAVFMISLFPILSARKSEILSSLKIPKKNGWLLFVFVSLLFYGAIRTKDATVLYLQWQSLVSFFFAPLLMMFFLAISFILFTRYKKIGSFDLSPCLYSLFLLMMLSFFVDKLVYGVDNKKMGGYLGSTNVIGNLFAIHLPFLFYLIRKKVSWLKGVFLFLAVLTIYLSFSRSAWLICVFSIFTVSLSLIQNGKYLDSFLVRKSILFYSFLLAGFVFMLSRSGLFDYENWRWFSSGRVSAWYYVKEYLSEPFIFFFGGGVNQFLNFHSQIDYHHKLLNTQNHLLKIWVDYGILMVILIFGFYQRLHLFLLDKIKEGTGDAFLIRVVWLCLMNFLFYGIFSHYSLYSSHYYVLGFELIYMISLLREEKMSKENDK